MGLTEFARRKVSRLDHWDFALVKWSVGFFALWVAFVYTPLTDWLSSVNPWMWLGVSLVLAIRPLYRVWLKEHTGIGLKVGAKITRSKKK